MGIKLPGFNYIGISMTLLPPHDSSLTEVWGSCSCCAIYIHTVPSLVAAILHKFTCTVRAMRSLPASSVMASFRPICFLSSLTRRAGDSSPMRAILVLFRTVELGLVRYDFGEK